MMKQVSIFALKTEGVLQAPAYPIAPARLFQLQRMPNPEARARSLAAELLLCWSVRHFRPLHVPSPPLRSYLPQGKPFFAENPAFAFSMSHSQDWAVLAVCDVPIGIDLEVKRQNRPHVVARYFHEQEKQDFFALPETRQAGAFYELWTLKESVVKATGAGMHLPFSQFAVSLSPVPRVAGLESPFSLFLAPFLENYCLGGCVQTEEPVSSTLRILSLEEALRGS